MFDRKPLGQQTEDDLTGGTYETQVFNMYAKLRGFHLTSGNTALAIHGMRSEGRRERKYIVRWSCYRQDVR